MLSTSNGASDPLGKRVANEWGKKRPNRDGEADAPEHFAHHAGLPKPER